MDYLQVFSVIVIGFVIIKASVNICDCLTAIHYELKRTRVHLESQPTLNEGE